MKSLFDFIVTPVGDRYSNKKKIGDKELILNTEISGHEFVNRYATVVNTPVIYEGPIKPGDEIIIHHNVFRRFYDVRGNEKNSKSYFKEDQYFCQIDQVFLYKQNEEWITPDDFCFVKPITKRDKFSTDKEEPLKGVVKYLNTCIANMGISEGDLIGFTPDSEYEFVIDGQRLYRIPINSISILYGHQRNQAEYNTSWATGS